MSSGVYRAMGIALVVYSVLYTVQVVFGSLYSEVLSASDVFGVMNYLTAAGIVISVTVMWTRRRCAGSPDTAPGPYLAARAGFYSALALAILFFTLWFRLLMLGEGESLSTADDFAWYLVAVLNPLVLGTTGAILSKTSTP